LLNKSSILITGGTGSFGHEFIKMTLKKFSPKKIIIFSRDEMKQWHMKETMQNNKLLRFIIGDVRDKERLYRAINGVDYVIKAAATKIFQQQSMTLLNV
jgi:Predicted nucleoside-diphosphate sugar epimerases